MQSLLHSRGKYESVQLTGLWYEIHTEGWMTENDVVDGREEVILGTLVTIELFNVSLYRRPLFYNW